MAIRLKAVDQKIEKLLKNLQSQKIGVFCDDSNLYHAYKNYGWGVDFGKLKKLLESYCDLRFINYHVAVPHRSDSTRYGTEEFMNKIEPFVELKKKDLKYVPASSFE